MHAAAISPRGGVARRVASLWGQAIIEYVLIIAVISLVVAFAGPQVSGAIRNQFSSISSALANGVSGTVQRPSTPSTPSQGSGGGSGGSSSGSGSNNPDKEQKDYLDDMKTVTGKDPKDWTLEDQKKVAEDIAEKGTASAAFPKAKDAMDAGTKWTVTLNDGKTLEYRIIGINHDDLIDGSGKAGLTFETTSDFSGGLQMNSTDTNIGGWEKSNLRRRLNSGDLWNLLPSELTAGMKQVAKVTDNTGGGKTGKPTVTADKVFLLSVTEVFGNKQSDGVQYEYYADKGVNITNFGGASSAFYHWTRTAYPERDTNFRCIYGDGGSSTCRASGENRAFPAFCL